MITFRASGPFATGTGASPQPTAASRIRSHIRATAFVMIEPYHGASELSVISDQWPAIRNEQSAWESWGGLEIRNFLFRNS